MCERGAAAAGGHRLQEGDWEACKQPGRYCCSVAAAVLQALCRLKARLDGLPLEEVAPQPRAAAISISEDTLLPPIGEGCCSLRCLGTLCVPAGCNLRWDNGPFG